jgi:fused signal recognition particle receptor
MVGGLFGRLRAGLTKTRETLLGKVEGLLQGRTRIDEEFLESLEEVLIGADFGMKVTQELVAALRQRARGERETDPERLRAILAEEVAARLPRQSVWERCGQPPTVVMLVGVNGVGKTTTIGKLAAQFVGAGEKVVIGAGDTFRAAAAEQLQVWGERAGADVIRHAEGADPGAVAFDAARAAVARNADLLLLDTAGRLHTKVNLMEELKKVRRVLAREIPGAPHETWLVLDATTGQNALSQARIFRDTVEASGIILTKLDGTAKGGIVVAIGAELGLPVRFIGVGEGVDDLRAFDAGEFVAALFQKS